MPDFDAMGEAELKAWRLAKNLELHAIRTELRESGLALQRLRARKDREEYDRVVAEYGAEAVAAASRIIEVPPATADGRVPEIGA